MQLKIGEFMYTEGYPLLPTLTVHEPESALIHAIVHRESMFNTEAGSPAGARGLMQLMPGTAKQVARSIGKSYSADKLTENPQYNIELGAAYLQHLLENYDNFYPLAIAAYNAGPANVAQWEKEFGDPRSSKVNLLDWIEQIPIYETRNYIQRVMESYYIYRLRLNQEPRTVLGAGKG
jgi:soluble lytic murein transglycosylase